VDAGIPLGLICENHAQLTGWRQLRVEYVLPHYTLARKELISEIKSAGRKVFVWTVNVTSDMKRFAQWGVDGIISDNPKRLALAVRRPVRKR
jgi:glycerophosphoryl diester phosphodiesterase